MKSKLLFILALFISYAANAQDSAGWVMVKNEHYTDSLSMLEMHNSAKTATYKIAFPQCAHNDWHIHPVAAKFLHTRTLQSDIP